MLDPEIGTIALWQGAIVDIPEFWLLCDGQNGTPDLRNQMVVGSQSLYAQDQTGGVTQHPHDFTADGHVHRYPLGAPIKDGTNIAGLLTSSQLTGTSDNASAQPPYYSLAFIMFVGE